MLASGRSRIAIDIGGVIEDSWPDKQAWLLRQGISPQRIFSRSELLNILPDGAYDDLLHAVFAETAILQHPLVPGAATGVLALAERYDVVLLSSRSAAKRSVTQQWLERKGLGILVDRIVSVGNAVSKLAWCRGAGVACVIEDDATRFFDPLATDVLQIHFNRNERLVSRPTSTTISTPTWGDVMRVLDTWHPPVVHDPEVLRNTRKSVSAMHTQNFT
jgi:hypothetical protein